MSEIYTVVDLKRDLKERSYDIHNFYWEIDKRHICIYYNGVCVSIINRITTGLMNTRCSNVLPNNSLKQFVLDVSYKFARTPVEDREPKPTSYWKIYSKLPINTAEVQSKRLSEHDELGHNYILIKPQVSGDKAYQWLEDDFEGLSDDVADYVNSNFCEMEKFKVFQTFHGSLGIDYE